MNISISENRLNKKPFEYIVPHFHCCGVGTKVASVFLPHVVHSYNIAKKVTDVQKALSDSTSFYK